MDFIVQQAMEEKDKEVWVELQGLIEDNDKKGWVEIPETAAERTWNKLYAIEKEQIKSRTYEDVPGCEIYDVVEYNPDEPTKLQKFMKKCNYKPTKKQIRKFEREHIII
jgi:hypothetical protein